MRIFELGKTKLLHGRGAERVLLKIPAQALYGMGSLVPIEGSILAKYLTEETSLRCRIITQAKQRRRT
jgi:hypothetical protein